MANQTARKSQSPKPAQKAETIAEADRDGRVDEPDAAPLETDANAAGHGAGQVPRAEPSDTYMVDSDGEVRAGPGDAGRQDAPERLPRSTDPAPQGIRRMMVVLGIAAALMAVIYLVAF